MHFGSTGPRNVSLYIAWMGTLTDPANWGVVGMTVLVLSIIITLHYEMLRNCIRLLPAVAHKRRRRVIFLILVILLTHAVEIWIFGIAYAFLARFGLFGVIEGTSPALELIDYVYFSAMVYTTVGFGDLVPEGPIRFMAGMEALTGLVMITWSASFTFLEMQRDWREQRD